MHHLMVHGSYGGGERFTELEFEHVSDSRVRPAVAFTHQKVDKAERLEKNRGGCEPSAALCFAML